MYGSGVRYPQPQSRRTHWPNWRRRMLLVGGLQGLIVASEAVASGMLTRQQVRANYTKLYRNVHVINGLEVNAFVRARAAWLWSGRKAVVIGHSAAALLRTLWIPPDIPAELARIRTPAPPGIVVHSGRLASDEVCLVGDVGCTTAARTGIRPWAPPAARYRHHPDRRTAECHWLHSGGGQSGCPALSRGSWNPPTARGVGRGRRRRRISEGDPAEATAGSGGLTKARHADSRSGPAPRQSAPHRYGVPRMEGRRGI